jgi:hypothetical protein
VMESGVHELDFQFQFQKKLAADQH